MIHVPWDSSEVHGCLVRLTADRGRFRFRRTLRRIGSTRRILATTLAAAFVVVYILSGVFILATRAPADPERLRLWLSGGMAMYLMYHLVRCAWAEKVADLELTDAESLWLGGAPVQRSSITIYHVSNVIVESVLKSLLLVVILARDVFHLELLVIGLVTSFVGLQIGRLILKRWIGGLDPRKVAWLRFFATAMAAMAALQVIARLCATIPTGAPVHHYVTGTFSAMGEMAASDLFQWLSLPWWAASHLMVARTYDASTVASLLGSVAMVPLGVMLLVHTDAWVMAARLRIEQERLARGEYQTATRIRGNPERLAGRFGGSGLVERLLPGSMYDAAAMIHRQAITARRYRGTILFSFAIPTLLCLSPLATGQTQHQWIYVVGGIALCTLLLAPPAMQIDFRRDLKRMMLLRSLPVRPHAMVLGQISIPVLVTLTFQWVTIAIASTAIGIGWSQTILWLGLLGALALFTFTAENALFLTFPHHQHRQGIAMMIRAKLVFLGKFGLMLTALTLLLIWISLCERLFASPLAGPAMVVVPIAVAWGFAIASLAVTTWCWKRFELQHDIPPQ